MVCKKCGASLMEDDQFCPECGAKVIRKKKCPECGDASGGHPLLSQLWCGSRGDTPGQAGRRRGDTEEENKFGGSAEEKSGFRRGTETES